MEGKGSVSLRPWTMEDKEDLARLCNGVDRSYVRNSLPSHIQKRTQNGGSE